MIKVFIIIVKTFPNNIDGVFEIDSTVKNKPNIIKINRMLPIIEIIDIIRVVRRAHDFPFKSP
jgi:hypothetical protein